MLATANRSPLNILITDDDSGMRDVLSEIVRNLGSFEVQTASCGDEALKIARVNRVHLALLDMQMPRLTGLETLGLMRRFISPLPAILITADADAELEKQAAAAHVFQVIPKPFHKKIVSETVARALVRYYGDEALAHPPGDHRLT
jgi:two-component system, response regulator PdtaR